LLGEVKAASPHALAAQEQLLLYLQKLKPRIKAKFDRDHAPKPDEYWIHDAKFNQELLKYLTKPENNLAWQSIDPTDTYGKRTWYALHPTLGSAIMTTIGLSIARDEQADIVTPSAAFHETLLTTNQDEIFHAILSGKQTTSVSSQAQRKRDLSQLVVTMTGINYQALRPEDIPELQASKHFSAFQQQLQKAAQSIPTNQDPRDYTVTLKQHAEKIINEWQENKSKIGRNLKDVLYQTGLTLSALALKASIKGPDWTDLFISGGVAIGVLINKGKRIREQRREDPFQYLTTLAKAQNETLRITYPLGLER